MIAPLLHALLVLAQGATPVAAPATNPAPVVLTLDEFQRRVIAQHPVARAARLGRDQAVADVTLARGAFDPTIAASWDRKAKKGVESYNEFGAELKVPTLPGVDLKLGYTRGAGPNINPEYITANSGQLSLGVSIPIGQRLLTDERRNALEQARAARDLAEGDRQSLINGLMLRATRDYGRWYEAWRRSAIATEGVTLSVFRLRAVVARVRNGEAPAIDTLEGRLEVQRRTAQQLEAQQALFAATQTLQAYLWDARGGAEDLATGVVPTATGLGDAPVDTDREAAWITAAEQAHPELAKISARIRQLEAQRRLVVQQFLPLASVDLASIADGDKGADVTDVGGFTDNYKFGASFRSPVLWVRERARATQALQRLDQQRVLQTQLRRDIAAGIRISAADARATDQLLLLQRAVVEQARALLVGEQRRFDQGESSLLIVNIRERLVLDEEVRLATLQSRAAAVRAELAVAIGAPGRLP